MTTEEKRITKRISKRAALIGIVLGLACNLLPADYRAACHAILNVCTGGF
jgi:hypothetical protein